jgi:hypothetical protein
VEILENGERFVANAKIKFLYIICADGIMANILYSLDSLSADKIEKLDKVSLIDLNGILRESPLMLKVC